MIHELTQRFYFEAAHTLRRRVEQVGRTEASGSSRIHGHTYQAEVSVRGERNPATGMVVDLASLRTQIGYIRAVLDHALLDEVDGLGAPTLENLCEFIARGLAGFEPAISSVRVWREASGDSCRLVLAPG